MNGLSDLSIEHVLVLKPAVDAGLILRSAFVDRVFAEPLNMHKARHDYVVYTPGTEKIWSFADFLNAWCWFVGRRDKCPTCRGDGYTGDDEANHPRIACSVCGGFGLVTEQQLFDLRMPRESLFPGGE